MKASSEDIKRFPETLYSYAPHVLLLALVLIRIPPFTLPFAGSLFQTHNFFRGLIIVLLAILLAVKRRDLFHAGQQLVYPFVIAFFLAESISVLFADNITSYLLVYKDIAFSFLIFMVTAGIIRKKHVPLLSLAFTVATAINMAFQFITYFIPAITETFLQPLLYDRYWQFLNYQLSRNRYFGDSFDEITIPLFFYIYFSSTKKFNRIISLLLIAAIIFITIISNWRTKALVLAVVFLWSCMLYIRKRLIFIIFALVVTVGLAANSISMTTIGFNVYDRFLLSDITQVQTLGGRLSYWKEAAEIGLQHPLTGAGLGNYYDNLSQKSKMGNQQSPYNHTILVDDPHNIFMSLLATTGFAGLISFLLLMCCFAVFDFRNFRSASRIFIMMFWGLFVFSLFNPFQYASFLYLFWLLRGIITGINSHEKH